MLHRLRWHGLSTSYRQHLLLSLFILTQLLWTSQVSAQSLDTEPLTVTAVCPGSQIDVTGLRSAAAGDFTIQLSSDGGTTYADIPSVFLTASGRYEITYEATIPASTPAGSNYRVRIVSKNPDVNGTPSPTILTVKAISPTPTVSAMSFCQGSSPGQLTAVAGTGGTLNWYTSASAGTASSVGPTPSTTNTGTVNYYVSQTSNGSCESQRVALPVTINSTPAAPSVQAVTSCQNAAAPVLQATGQNLLWYAGSTGGMGTTAIPTVSTSQAGQVSYYVSQSINGCESPRATLTVTVTPLPAAPGVTTKNICQFAPPEAVSAMGDGLTWYNIDGNKFPSAPVITTTTGASFSVLVTQTVNGCEGPKATLTINVLTTPAPTVSKATVEVCQGTTAQPLSATGTNLKWTDPNGNVTTTAPTPPTQTTTKPDGNVYYVTQTINGCESPKVAITLFVQTTPTLSILGTATTNLGLSVQLQLAFTGVGPYQYKLSNGLTGTATKDTTITVSPTGTTIYQATEVTNKCGAGLVSNATSATITVLVPTIQTLPFTSTTLCAGTSLTTNFSTTGTFNPGSIFKLQLAKVDTDSTKITYADVAGSQVSNGQAVGTIPANTTAGSYRVRVVATNPTVPIIGTFSSLTIRALPAATLIGTQTISQGQPASLSVAFSGDAPWNFSYRDSSATGLGTIQAVITNTNPHILAVNPLKTTSYFLTNVSNACGTGSLTARGVVVTVSPLLGIEDQSLAEAIDVYPVPATTNLTVRINGLPTTQTALLELTDLTGKTTSRQETRQATSLLSLDQHPAGTYILTIQVGDRKAARRIVKL